MQLDFLAGDVLLQRGSKEVRKGLNFSNYLGCLGILEALK
jgi:hypothetical protein